MEMLMQDGTVHVIAAETEEDMNAWFAIFQRVIEQQKMDSNSDKQSVTSFDGLDHGEQRHLFVQQMFVLFFDEPTYFSSSLWCVLSKKSWLITE